MASRVGAGCTGVRSGPPCTCCALLRSGPGWELWRSSSPLPPDRCRGRAEAPSHWLLHHRGWLAVSASINVQGLDALALRLYGSDWMPLAE